MQKPITAEPLCDVAISFCVADQTIAQAVADRLEDDGLKVFFFPHRQEELASTDGIVSMREPFLRSRVNVVMFKTPWGETNWTRVEDLAIQEAFLKKGFTSLMVVTIDEQSPLPAWVPPNLVRFAFADYGLEQLIGAIKLRVIDEGGKPEPRTASSEAKRIARRQAYTQKRSELMRDRKWIENLHASVRESYAALSRLVEDANSEHAFGIQMITQDLQACLRYRFVSMTIRWEQRWFHTVAEPEGQCGLKVVDYSGRLILPGERAIQLRDVRPIASHTFRADVAEDLGLIWTNDRGEQVPPSQLADKLMLFMLDLVAKVDDGRVSPPSLVDED